MYRVALCVVLFVGCHGYRHYQDNIPNGDNVPHPCKDNFLWRGVGHMNPGGGGPRNPFGVDFAKNGHEWTNDLCKKDSDGDGKSNGEELGDPQCTWSKNNFPDRTSGISHPGICEPWGSAQCEEGNRWVSCDAGIFNCSATQEPDVKNFTLRFPQTKVPPMETNYYCMPFLVEDYLNISNDYHLIASKPQINNSNVMHHIILFGCSDEVEISTEAKPCYMAQEGCSDIIGVWTLGLPGTCEYKDAGILIGKSGRKKMVMQFHWTNPELRTDYVDSSGLTLFYTPKRRRYNSGMLLSGQLYLNIPPGSPRTVFESSCTGYCTDKLISTNIFLTSGISHMHYLGYTETVDQLRQGQSVRRLINDINYSYDSPEVHTFKEPFEFRQGDELKTTCVYKSVSKKRTTLYGEGSFDEMCYSLFSYYPKENLTETSCHQWKTLDMCKYRLNDMDGCDMTAFWNSSSDQFRPIIKEVMDSCNYWGPCRPECPAVVEKVRKHPCFKGEVGEFQMTNYAGNRDVTFSRFAHALASCDSTTKMNFSPDFPQASSASLPVTSLLMTSFLFFLNF